MSLVQRAVFTAEVEYECGLGRYSAHVSALGGS